MKTTIKVLILSLVLLALHLPAIGASSTNANDAAILDHLNLQATDYIAIPYAGYRTQSHEIRVGLAVLYEVTTNFWAGIRYEGGQGRTDTVGVQAQLQTTREYFGMSWTPFLETSVGIGRSDLYGDAGGGLVTTFKTWKIKQKYDLTLGVVVAWWHYVDGDQNGNQVNAGPLAKLSW